MCSCGTCWSSWTTITVSARPPLVTTQMPMDNWHELISDPTLADTSLDRLAHNAYRIQLKGQSMRMRAKKLTEPGASD